MISPCGIPFREEVFSLGFMFETSHFMSKETHLQTFQKVSQNDNVD